MTRRADYGSGVVASLPIILGYFPVAMSFGLIAVQAGLSIQGAVLISAVVYSGASQFLLIAMISSGVPLLLAFGLCLVLNIRHVFYGPVLSSHLPLKRSAFSWLVAFGLTDEVFAVAHTRLKDKTESSKVSWLMGLSNGAYFSWVLGTVVGAVASERLLHSSTIVVHALQFALPALFFLLLLPNFKQPMLSGILMSFAVAASAAWYGQAALGIVFAAVMGTLTYLGETWCRRSY
ncbi:MAG: hypothetical protein CENE_02254 [Candidatus Celerinatantimonas neptuna]|nr:MAG: hypothetical protein CENE_02254 [Candidatus Celerinatantimonas neptuna]